MLTQKNSKEQIIKLFELYEQKMYYIANAILHDSHQAEDAVMDAFERLLKRNYKIIDPDLPETKKLIIKVIRSCAIDLYRKNQKEQEKQILSKTPETFCKEQGLEPHFLSFEDAEYIIKDLPKTYYDVMFLRYVKDYSMATIASTLGISENAARKRHERAIRMLKEKEIMKGNCYYGKTIKTI